MFKSIVFDLDGTLCDTLPLAIESFRKALYPIYKRNLKDEEITKHFGSSEEGTINSLAPDDYENSLNRYWANLVDLHDMCKCPFDGIEKVLDFLKSKGVNLFVVTGRTIKSANISLDYFKLQKYFIKIYGGVKDYNNKFEQLKKIISEYNFNQEDILYVGDTPSDIIQAKKAKVKMASALWSKTIHEMEVLKSNPDYIFYSVDSFYEFLLKIYKN